jgi:hypothetical protein
LEQITLDEVGIGQGCSQHLRVIIILSPAEKLLKNCHNVRVKEGLAGKGVDEG